MINSKPELRAEYSLNNLVYFIRLSALGLLLLTLFVETKRGLNDYQMLDIFSLMQGGWLNIPLLPGMSVSFFSFGWFPAFIEIFNVLAFVLLFLKPTHRASYILAASALVMRNVCSHLTVGVHTTSVFLIPLLLLGLEPPNKENSAKIRQRLIVAIALMYLFSALVKMNPTFLSGVVVENSFLYRRSLKTFLDWLATFKATILLGPLLEFFAFFVIFKKTRKAALLCALVFHMAVSIWIFLSVGLTVFGCSLLFLVTQEQDLKVYYRRLIYISVAVTAVLFGLNFTFAESWAHYQTIVYDGVSIAMAAVATFGALAILLKLKNEPVNYVSIPGILLPVTYVGLSFALGWPEPFGYTQYAGLRGTSYAIVLPLHEVEKHPRVHRLIRRWRTRGLSFSASNEFVAIFPTLTMSKNFIDYYAQLEPHCEYKLYTSNTRENFERLVRDYSFRRSSFETLPRLLCVDEN
ncbi:MAG: hypothetical protein HUU57_03855 [Bdellovibrio sp.]|nr:hypothetical protein [Bdellovibrio sp.]